MPVILLLAFDGCGFVRTFLCGATKPVEDPVPQSKQGVKSLRARAEKLLLAQQVTLLLSSAE
eukprot:1303241-Amphidinium_carterae.1